MSIRKKSARSVLGRISKKRVVVMKSAAIGSGQNAFQLSIYVRYGGTTTYKFIIIWPEQVLGEPLPAWAVVLAGALACHHQVEARGKAEPEASRPRTCVS